MLGDRLKRLRNTKGLTQQEVADRLHMSRGTYAHYEINKRQPDYDTLQRFADFFDCTVDYLLGREREIPPNVGRKPSGNSLFPGGVIGRGKTDDDDDLLTPEEEERLRRLLTDPELGLAFRKGALAKNTNRRRLLMALELLASDDDEGWER